MTRAIMTIHGYLTNDQDFGILYDSLQQYQCVHRCIVPGHGDGDDFKNFTVEATLDKITSDFEMLASQYDTVDVVGFSMGGALASYLCAIRPVNKVVLLAPSNKYISSNSFGKWLVYLARKYSEPLLQSSGTLADRLYFASKYMEKDVDNLGVTLDLAGNMLEKITITNYLVFRNLMNISNKALDNATLESKLSTPAIIVIGGLDELVPYRSVEYLLSKFDNANVKFIDTLGHAMLRTSHDIDIIDAVLEHLGVARQTDTAEKSA